MLEPTEPMTAAEMQELLRTMLGDYISILLAGEKYKKSVTKALDDWRLKLRRKYRLSGARNMWLYLKAENSQSPDMIKYHCDLSSDQVLSKLEARDE